MTTQGGHSASLVENINHTTSEGKQRPGQPEKLTMALTSYLCSILNTKNNTESKMDRYLGDHMARELQTSGHKSVALRNYNKSTALELLVGRLNMFCAKCSWHSKG